MKTACTPHTQPATRRFFYACAVLAALVLTGCTDDLEAQVAVQADLADAIAQAAKEAGQ